MILSIHQPSYFPWLGLLHKIAGSDLYMVMDEVQLTDSAYQHRNQFLSADGKVKYLTIPFNKSSYLKRPFNALEIRDQSWRTDHPNFLWNSYRRHPFFDEIFPLLSDYYGAEYGLLTDAVMASMNICLALFEIKTEVVFQSASDYDRSLRRGDLVLYLVRKSGADCYLSGTGAKAYLDEASFVDGISLRYDHFVHPEYPQKNSPVFVPGLSCLDMLFNIGISESRRLFGGLLHK
jgi:hypothetical protein